MQDLLVCFLGCELWVILIFLRFCKKVFRRKKDGGTTEEDESGFILVF